MTGFFSTFRTFVGGLLFVGSLGSLPIWLKCKENLDHFTCCRILLRSHTAFFSLDHLVGAITPLLAAGW